MIRFLIFVEYSQKTEHYFIISKLNENFFHITLTQKGEEELNIDSNYLNQIAEDLN